MNFTDSDFAILDYEKTTLSRAIRRELILRKEELITPDIISSVINKALDISSYHKVLPRPLHYLLRQYLGINAYQYAVDYTDDALGIFFDTRESNTAYTYYYNCLSYSKSEYQKQLKLLKLTNHYS